MMVRLKPNRTYCQLANQFGLVYRRDTPRGPSHEPLQDQFDLLRYTAGVNPHLRG